MTDIIESLKQSADQVLSNIDQKGQLRSALDGIRHQWNEMERRRKVSALDKEIKAQQGEMKQLTEALGLQAWSLYDAGKIVHPELARLCERISELQAEIDAKKADLETLKAQEAAQAAAQEAAQGATQRTPPANQVRTVVRLRCPRCKTELTADDDYCPTCGVKILHPTSQGGTQAPAQSASQAQGPPRAEQPAAASGVRFCSSCGAETEPDARFCPICGQALH